MLQPVFDLKSLFASATRSTFLWATLRGHVPAELWYPRLSAGVRGGQLAFLFRCLDETAAIDGAVIEAGCAFGHTTILLHQYLQDRGIEKEYVCIDTFTGFTPDDIQYEHRARSKTFNYAKSIYARNSVDWFKTALKQHGIRDVRIFCTDIAAIKPGDLPPVSFCFLDFDLYQPVRRELVTIYERLSPGGMIVVDDCAVENAGFSEHKDRFDGALAAYREFAEAIGQKELVVERKLGIIRKPR